MKLKKQEADIIGLIVNAIVAAELKDDGDDVVITFDDDFIKEFRKALKAFK